MADVENAIAPKIEGQKTALDSLDQQVSDMQSEERKRAEAVGTRQGTLTDNLIYTELLMILAIVAAIFYLRVFPDQLAMTIVQERTLGDLLGMGLLLITIIFLATGEFVDNRRWLRFSAPLPDTSSRAARREAVTKGLGITCRVLHPHQGISNRSSRLPQARYG
ncbi:MAG: hypothetical protein M3Z32_09390 [Acidobacteriota bacterium]|nr:hypothetical protein [Acidobacteriota bacterium]